MLEILFPFNFACICTGIQPSRFNIKTYLASGLKIIVLVKTMKVSNLVIISVIIQYWMIELKFHSWHVFTFKTSKNSRVPQRLEHAWKEKSIKTTVNIENKTNSRTGAINFLSSDWPYNSFKCMLRKLHHTEWALHLTSTTVIIVLHIYIENTRYWKKIA